MKSCELVRDNTQIYSPSELSNSNLSISASDTPVNAFTLMKSMITSANQISTLISIQLASVIALLSLSFSSDMISSNIPSFMSSLIITSLLRISPPSLKFKVVLNFCHKICTSY